MRHSTPRSNLRSAIALEDGRAGINRPGCPYHATAPYRRHWEDGRAGINRPRCPYHATALGRRAGGDKPPEMPLLPYPLWGYGVTSSFSLLLFQHQSSLVIFTHE